MEVVREHLEELRGSTNHLPRELQSEVVRSSGGTQRKGAEYEYRASEEAHYSRGRLQAGI